MLRKLMPAPVRRLLKPAFLAIRRFLITQLIEPGEVWLGKRDPLLPPRSKMYIGGGDFSAIGEEFRQFFIDLCDLKPHQSVLDVGCGVGRIAVPLTAYLKSPGSYEGFDPVPEAIQWCRRYITTRFPGFRFRQVDVRNGFYHPTGRGQARHFTFPYAGEQFDLVMLVGVFTHMSTIEVDHYLSEIQRVLRPGGRVFTTFFLLDEVSGSLMSESASAYNFQYKLDGRYTFDPTDPNRGTAHDAAEILSLFEKNKLSLSLPVQYGDWSGRQPALSFLDIVVGQKIVSPGTSPNTP